MRLARFYCPRFYWVGAVLFLLSLSLASRAQEGFHTETSSGVNNIRIAVADFKPGSADPQLSSLKRTFDTTLYSDLANAGIFDIVSKSLLPESVPGAPAEINVQQWAAAPSAFPAAGRPARGLSGSTWTRSTSYLLASARTWKIITTFLSRS